MGTLKHKATHVMIKLFFIICVAIFALIPTWLDIGFRNFLSPEGFPQECFVLGANFYVFGFAQLFLLIAGIVAICIIITS